MERQQRNTILTITGSDGSGGAGIQADIKMIAALGGNAVSAITSITAQNTLGIQEFYDLPVSAITGQIEAIINDMQPLVVKVGMVRQADAVVEIAAQLQKHKPQYVIYDPVIISSQNEMLMTTEVIEEITRTLLPLCSLVIIKRADAEYFTKSAITTSQEMTSATETLLNYGCGAVLLQGGHLLSATNTDVFACREQDEPIFLSSLQMGRTDEFRHGLSGNLSSAIATFISNGNTLFEAVVNARNYMSQLLVLNTGLMGRSSELYNEFVDEIAKHHRTNNDVKFYADRLNVSSRYLAQVTRRISGKSPKNIIDEFLMQEIEQLLAVSDKTVQEIAYAFGFHSQAHFAKFFKKMNGLSPSEYRKDKRLNT